MSSSLRSAWPACAVVLAACGGRNNTAGVSTAQGPAPSRSPSPAPAPASATGGGTPTSSTAVFPLHVESGKRYLLDASGKTFFINGEKVKGEQSFEEFSKRINSLLKS